MLGKFRLLNFVKRILRKDTLLKKGKKMSDLVLERIQPDCDACKGTGKQAAMFQLTLIQNDGTKVAIKRSKMKGPVENLGKTVESGSQELTLKDETGVDA